MKDVSVIIALNNEENNIVNLYSRIREVLGLVGGAYELILVDDGSRDETYSKILAIHHSDVNVNVIRLGKKVGQILALLAGIHYSSGSTVVTMDGDLQHLPEDIPKFLENISQGYVIVNGCKKTREDNILIRIIPAYLVKKIVSFLFGTCIQDINSSFRAYRREVLSGQIICGENIRFAPLLIRNKALVCEIMINCKKRKMGYSHFGFLSRMKRFCTDISILWGIKTGNSKASSPVLNDLIKSKKFHL